MKNFIAFGISCLIGLSGLQSFSATALENSLKSGDSLPPDTRFEWGVDFYTIFDNREGDSKFTDTKTFFQTQLAPEIGVSFLGGEHRLMGGVVWTQPIGEEWDDYKISPTLYYRYSPSHGPWRFSMGMFPRTQLLERLPNYIWNDSNYYCQRNIRGALVQYEGCNGQFEALVDWRGMQTRRQREAFNIIAQGRWKRPGKLLMAGGVAMMNHFALVKDAPEDQHIVDNIMVNPWVGLDLQPLAAEFDSLTVKAGPLMSIIRNRAFGHWEAPTGVWLEAYGRWKWLGLQETVYAGGCLFPYYQEFGCLLDQGEPFLQSKYYWRTDIYGYILDRKFMNLTASLDFHVAQGCFTFYQRLMLRVFF